jgi:uncharacterized membrane protein YoaK (UPF0700 family)
MCRPLGSTIYFVWACALSCGLQNGLTSKYSGNVVRTTHLTGTTTDLGIALGHVLRGSVRPPRITGESLKSDGR